MEQPEFARGAGTPRYESYQDGPTTPGNEALERLLASWMGPAAGSKMVEEHFGDPAFLADTLRQLAEEVEVGLTPEESETFEQLNTELWRREVNAYGADSSIP